MKSKHKKIGLMERLVNFGEYFTDANQKIGLACIEYAQAVDDYGLKARKDFQKTYKDIPEGAWTQFEKVGRGIICVEMLTNFFPAVGVLENFNASMQRSLIKKGVTVYYKHGKTRKVPVKRMNALLIKQVFDVDGSEAKVRTLEEQKVWRSEYDSTSRSPSVPYNLAGGRMYIGKYALSVEDLEVIIAELKEQLALIRKEE